ncbi:riboflavin synthase alpha chain [Cohaesibacter sp. ES.047]|uniref:riboflavin synthase n=1 Tax=Cohaesibacter sp. ES.047 TaxID=1798205 RepID=UPI000BB7682F|nr:riboflavin synthase [Cohaesibacter sp. ES.047]SNY93089.1 riboflavin synthase alpha chain [Cohaesibacter sp. ES.047]
MFTGIVTDVGEVVVREDIPAGQRVRIATHFDPKTIAVGASIACSGVCHTVIEAGAMDDGRNFFVVESAKETLDLTTASEWAVGRKLNLERSLQMGDELGGHLVLGHVDGMAEIVERVDHPDSVFYKLRAPDQLARFIPQKGSVALDGCSLTVNDVDGDDFTIFLIPHTIAHTTFGEKQVGDKINLEVDMMARYIARLSEYKPS